MIPLKVPHKPILQGDILVKLTFVQVSVRNGITYSVPFRSLCE